MAKRQIEKSGRAGKFVGDRYGRLVVLAFVRDDFTPSGQKKPVYQFRCDCGAVCQARIYDARSGGVASCGCLGREVICAPKSHGAAVGSLSPTYRAWRNMLTRVTNPNIAHAARYVARGIDASRDWLPGGDGKGFDRFLSHVGSKPSSLHSLDRIDNDLGYWPGNVRWATRSEQMRNTSVNRVLHWQGRAMTMAEAAAEAGLPVGVLRDRLDKLGWSLGRAMTAPIRKLRRSR